MNRIAVSRQLAYGLLLAIAVAVAFPFAASLQAGEVVVPAEREGDRKTEARKMAEKATLEGIVTVTYSYRLKPERPPVLQPLASESDDSSFSYEMIVAADARFALQGYLVEPQTVICEDQDIDFEYVSSIVVSQGKESVKGTFSKIFKDRKVIQLTLDKPLAHARPLGPVCQDGKPEWAVSSLAQATEEAVRYGVRAKPADEGQIRFRDGLFLQAERGGEALFDSKGAFCGLRFGYQTAASSPDYAKWPSLSVSDLPGAIASAIDSVSKSVFPVVLRFRSPKKEGEDGRGYSSSRDNNALTEYKTTGTLVSGKRLLVDISNARSAIPRLEKISVFLPGGKVVAASFVFVHKRAQLLAADLPEAMAENVLQPYRDDVTTSRGRLTWLVRSIAIGAGQLDRRVGHFRPSKIERIWRDRPELGVAAWRGKGDFIVMTLDGKALWRRVDIRSEGADVGNDSSEETRSAFIPARDYISLATPGDRDVDSIRPVHADEDGAIGWIGLDFQAMNRALAEELGVLAETDNGDKGVIVSRVVPGSVSDEKGIRPGWILLTIQGPGMQFPLPVSLSKDDEDFADEFPWEYYDKIPVEMLERFPIPWPKVRTSIAKALFEMGIGKEITATFRVDGEEVVKKLVIEAGPRYFGNAPAYQWKEGGMTVCELTPEVREYLNLGPDDPGVVVSRMESSGRAAIAGIRRFEVIKKVNGVPVENIVLFERIVEGLAEVKLDVLRRSDTRVVRVTLSPNGD